MEEHWFMRFLVAVQLFEKITLLTMHLYSVVFVCFVYVSFIFFIYASCMVVCNVRWPNFTKQIGLLFGLRTHAESKSRKLFLVI